VPIRKSKSDAIQHLVGRWIAADEWATEVVLIVSNRNGKIRVRAVDQSDGEEAEILDLKVTKSDLCFAAYWSSGQLTKFRLQALGDQMLAVFTVTTTTTFKKTAKR
jgi:hypothetical protein